MTKMVDCLANLPNLRSLEVFSTTHIGPVTKGLNRRCAQFPTIRELWIGDKLAKFVGSCPNVEIVTATGRLSRDIDVLGSHGNELKWLKRVAGVHPESIWRGELRRILVWVLIH